MLLIYSVYHGMIATYCGCILQAIAGAALRSHLEPLTDILFSLTRTVLPNFQHGYRHTPFI